MKHHPTNTSYLDKATSYALFEMNHTLIIIDSTNSKPVTKQSFQAGLKDDDGSPSSKSYIYEASHTHTRWTTTHRTLSNGGDPSLQQSYDPPWIAIIVTSKVTKIIGLHQQGRPMLSSEMNHLSNNINVKFWYEGWRWLRSYQFETFVGVWYTTINWWRHTINILLDIAIHTEMWLCWVWGLQDRWVERYPGEKERTLYLPDNQPRWKDTTIH